MKRILGLLLVMGLLICESSSAQRATVFPLVGADSLTNADTVTKIITATAGYDGIVIQPVVTKVSGTAAGTVILSQSLDGVNYVPTDTLTLTNTATQTTIWSKKSPVPVYYKVVGTSSGTVVEILRVYYVLRKHD